MIPKTIHYCWFGGNPLPELAQRCIASWRKFLPDYEIREWNESNYDVRKIPYTAQAYDAKKYAFVSDYARFDILYEHGGVYFDTDVEVIKPFTSILQKGAYLGIEKGWQPLVNAGLGMAVVPQDCFCKEILESYQDEKFIKPNGAYNQKTVVVRVSKILNKYGFKEIDTFQVVHGLNIYPSDYFCPKDYRTGDVTVTENTCSIHHYEASWLSTGHKIFAKLRKTVLRKLINNTFFLKMLQCIQFVKSKFN